MIIGMTDPMHDASREESYRSWIRSGIPEGEVLVLSHTRNLGDEIERCDGIVLTGGGDVDPKFYGREDAVREVREVSEARDQFEFQVIRRARERNLPLLGICRGVQVFNVAMGGSLVPDLERAGFPPHGRPATGERRHRVRIASGTFLGAIAGVREGEVNSYHHQAVERPGRGLRVVARADDGVVEAVEWERPAGKPWLVLVQWHPERMRGPDDPLSRNIIHQFAHAVNTRDVTSSTTMSPT
jgi:putative glutamine amidotransferase